MGRVRLVPDLFKKWKRAYERLPDVLQQYLRRFRFLIYLIPLMGVLGLQSMGMKVTLIMILSLEGMLVISWYLTLEEFLEGQYLCCQGEIIKIEDQTVLMPFIKRKKVLTIKTNQGAWLSVALRLSEVKAFSEGSRIIVYAPGGRANRFGVIELWGYYNIHLIQEERV